LNFKNLLIFSPFWFCLLLYLYIPLFIKSIEPPSWAFYLDDYLPFFSFMIIPYYFYYILIVIPPFIIDDASKIKKLTTTLIKSSIVCYIIFVFWPISSSKVLSSVPERHFFKTLHDLITYDFLHQNAFPSMHVVITFIIGMVLAKEFPKFKFIFIALLVGIFVATFLIKQHYFVDSFAGLLVGLFYYKSYNQS
tara:strand:+ start:379 stop:957 length:579 start_codon:yes stop_codon:yes gene_type:complete